MKNKKNIITIIVAIVLLIGCLLLVLWKNNLISHGKQLQEDMFAIKDSSAVTKIFIADMHENHVLLIRTPKGWMLSDSIPAVEEKVQALLSTMLNIRIQIPVTQKGIPDAVNTMLVAGIKVEIYEKKPLFTLFNKGFFVKERKAKTYYMGPATQSNVANFAILEGYEDTPFIVAQPGFRGFLTPRYSPFKEDWVSHHLFATKPTRVQEILIQDIEHPEQSYRVEKSGTRFFKLFNSQNVEIAHYDTTKLLNFVSEFKNRNYENIADLPEEEIKHILKDNLFKIITLKDVSGNTFELKLYKMDENMDYYDEKGNKIEDVEYYYNKDRCYGVFNGQTDQIYVLQYFHIDRILQPLSFYAYTPQEAKE